MGSIWSYGGNLDASTFATGSDGCAILTPFASGTSIAIYDCRGSKIANLGDTATVSQLRCTEVDPPVISSVTTTKSNRHPSIGTFPAAKTMGPSRR